MKKSIKIIRISNWLEAKMISRDCGILLANPEINSFDIIQNFIENCDREFQTPVIYYQAFPQETTLQFLDTLGEELVAKLGNNPQDKSKKSFSEIVKDAELNMIIIDNCYLYPQDTLENLLKIFADCNIGVILAGEQQKMTAAQLLNHPVISHWDKLNASCSTISS